MSLYWPLNINIVSPYSSGCRCSIDRQQALNKYEISATCYQSSVRHIYTSNMGWSVNMLSWVICITVISRSAFAICDIDWVDKDLYCYYVSENKTTFNEAVGACAEAEAQLVDINESSENLHLYFISAAITGESYWIGYEEIIKGLWRWKATGLQGSFFKWDIGEPDGEGKCARLTPYTFGAWRDRVCESRLPYICKKFADCGVPTEMDHANVSYSQLSAESRSGLTLFAVNTEAYYSCHNGYEYLDGEHMKSSTCQQGGVWYPNLVNEGNKCVPKKCPPPPIFDHLHINVSLGQYYNFGTVVSYTCDANYWFSAFASDAGSKYLTCQSNKQWGGTEIKHCTEMSCIRPITPNSSTNTSLNTNGTIALYRCNKGYQFPDRDTQKLFTCTGNAWVPQAVLCQIKVCPEHTVIGAVPDTTSRVYDTTVKWECERGLQYRDTGRYKFMRCLDTEQWDKPITDRCDSKCANPSAFYC